MARLDRLGRAKDVAQTAAALGREFGHAILAAISPLPPATLRAALDQLRDAQLLSQQGTDDVASYRFSHALVQDCAYGSMLLSTRRALHHKIADVMEHAFPQMAESQPEVVAHHLTEAQLSGRAVAWWRRAGQRNARTSANIEAVAHFEQCLELLTRLPEGRERDIMELDVRIDLGVPLTGVGGYTAPQFLANTTRVLALCERAGDSARLYPVLWGQITHHFSTGDMRVALALARRFLGGAEQQQDRQLHMIGERLCGLASFGLGELKAARRHFESALELYDRAQHLPLAHIYGLDQRVAALAYLSITEHRLGRADLGLRLAEDALREALALEHAPSTMYAQGKMIELHMLRREWHAAERAAAEYLHTARERRAPNHELLARAAVQIAQIGVEPRRDAETEARDSLDALRRLNWNYQVTWLVLAGVEAFAESGHPKHPAQWLEEARALVEAPGQDVWVPDLHLAHAAVLASRGEPAGTVREGPGASPGISISTPRRPGYSRPWLRAARRRACWRSRFVKSWRFATTG